jgi:glycosyltransferase involved in cell wall biosynthesis
MKKAAPDAEIVVVDTGSTDKTVEIAKEYTDKVFFFEWCDDFSKAKNFAADKASCDYIVSIDADEYIEKIDLNQIVDFLTKHPNATGSIRLANLMNTDEGVSKYFIEVTRIYDRRHVHFEDRIHEQLKRLDKKKSEVALLDVEATHVGYLISGEELLLKNKRNIKLLEKELTDNPNDPYLLFQLGQSLLSIGEAEKAFNAYSKALDQNPPLDAPYVEPLILGFGDASLAAEKFKEALRLEEYYDEMSHIGDYMYTLGRAYLINERGEDALMAFKLATTAKKVYLQGMNDYYPLYALSVVYENFGETELSKQYEQEALKYKRG